MPDFSGYSCIECHVGTQVPCSQLILSASSAVLQAYYPRVCLDILLQTYGPELDGLDSRIKFVSLIFPYALSKHPSEGSLNVLRVSHDAFGAILLLGCPTCVAHILAIASLSRCGRVGAELCNRDDISRRTQLFLAS